MVPPSLTARRRAVSASGRLGRLLVPLFFMILVHLLHSYLPSVWCSESSSPLSVDEADAGTGSPVPAQVPAPGPLDVDGTSQAESVWPLPQPAPAPGHGGSPPLHSFQRLWQISNGADRLTEAARRASQATAESLAAETASIQNRGSASAGQVGLGATVLLSAQFAPASDFTLHRTFASPFPSMWPPTAAAQVPLALLRERLGEVQGAARRRQQLPEMITDPQFQPSPSRWWSQLAEPSLVQRHPHPGRSGPTGEAFTLGSGGQTRWEPVPHGRLPTPSPWQPSPVLDPWSLFRQWGSLQPGPNRPASLPFLSVRSPMPIHLTARRWRPGFSPAGPPPSVWRPSFLVDHPSFFRRWPLAQSSERRATSSPPPLPSPQSPSDRVEMRHRSPDRLGSSFESLNLVGHDM